VRLNPGADYFTRCAPAKVKARAIGQLEALSLQVTIASANDPENSGLPAASPRPLV
jgi:hypothetical protein